MAKPINVRALGAADARGDLIVVPCLRGKAPETDGLRPELAEAAARAAKREGFLGKRGQTAAASAGGGNPTSVLVKGLGKGKELDREELQRYVKRAIGRSVKDGFANPVVVLPDHPTAAGEAHAESVVRTAAMSGYAFGQYRSKPGDQPPDSIGLVSARHQADYEAATPRAVATAKGARLTCDLANTPPNDAHPEWMASQARAIGERHGMKVRVLEPGDMEKEGMGGILAVGRGSRRPPRLAVLEWGEGEKKVSLVGKGVTFDTGGISLKPPATMDEMKFDKAGACTVMGIAEAAATLDLPFRFRAYLPFAENMPDGEAYRPGDIIRCYNDKTVEILNTDAEGRLLLADALALADEEGADVILDYATLTGACVVALGHRGAGLFSHNDDLAGELLAASTDSNEKLWRLPLWPEFSKAMNGRHADLINSGGRWGGASTAAAFLSRFVKSKNWAHLDIAGPAYVGAKEKGPFGATGYGVALTIAWLHRLAHGGALGAQ